MILFTLIADILFYMRHIFNFFYPCTIANLAADAIN